MSSSTTPEDATESAFAPMVQVDMEIADFRSAWPHCDYLSAYMARMVSHNRSDSVVHSTVFSSALNELLEIAFRARRSDGSFVCRVSRQGTMERVELTFPCTQEDRQLYEEAATRSRDAEAVGTYLNSLSQDVTPSSDIVLRELAINHDAVLRIRADEGDTITLIADLPLEGLAN
jgi:hypothetical protein